MAIAQRVVETVSVEELWKQYEAAQATIARQQELLAEKEALIAKLQHLLFGRSSEKNLIPPPPPSAQLDIFGEQGEATQEEVREEVSEPGRERSQKPRQPLPKDLPRQDILLDLRPEEKACSCCGREMTCIGEETTEKLALVPARLYVKRYRRQKYACGRCKEGISSAPLPAMALPRASADATLLAFLLISKYADHLPLCRMERIFVRHGIDLPRRKTCEWLMEVAGLLSPLDRLMRRRVVGQSAVIGADETPIRMLEPGGKRRESETCHLWVYNGDGAAPHTIFDFQRTRSREGPLAMLGGYGGWLQSDDYTVYRSLANEPGTEWKRAGCWAHARRKFVEAARAGDTRAEAAVEIIGRLYAVERSSMESGADARQALRREKSLPVLGELRAWMESRLDALPKSPLGKAIAYTLDNWRELIVYTTDGRLPIDNNAVERAIRPVAVGRKNWLFAGSERGGEAAATFLTLIESARRANVNLWEYVTDLLERLPAHPVNRLEELLPDHWQANRA